MDRKTKILEFDFSSDAERHIFLKKLSGLHGWPDSFCQKAFTEYKRFIYLAATTGGRVVPSRIIDNVWHLHLTFTKSYWHDFCRERIGKDIQHNPSRADTESRVRDRADYQKTLDLYRASFGTEPSEEFWLNAGGSTRKTSNRPLWLAVAGATTLLAACSTLSDFKGSTTFFVVLIVLFFAVSSLLSGGARKKKRGRKRQRRSGTASGSDCGSCSSCSSCGGGGD